jgi:hypothetical protein
MAPVSRTLLQHPKPPHPEEQPKAASRRTHRRDCSGGPQYHCVTILPSTFGAISFIAAM